MRASSPATGACSAGSFHLLASIWVVGDVKDTQCGFKGFTREAAQDLFARQQVTSIVFDVELIYPRPAARLPIAVVPIRWEDVRGSRMRARPGTRARVAWDLFRIPLVHRRIATSDGGRRREWSRHADTRRVRAGPLSALGLVVGSRPLSCTGSPDRDFDAGRGDFFYLADAFLHGRTWLTFQPGPVRRDHHRRPVLRAVRAVPGRRAHAGRRGHRGRHRRPGRVRRSTRSWRPAASGCAGWLLGRIGVQRLVDRLWLVDPVRVLDADPVGHDPRRRLAHRPPDRDDPDLRLPHRAVGPAAGLAHRAVGRGGVPDPGAARLRDPVLRAPARSARRRCRRATRRRVRRSAARSTRLRGVGRAGHRRPAGDRRVLRLQPGPLRDAARVRVRAGDPAAVPRSAARASACSRWRTSR